MIMVPVLIILIKFLIGNMVGTETEMECLGNSIDNSNDLVNGGGEHDDSDENNDGYSFGVGKLVVMHGKVDDDTNEDKSNKITETQKNC